MLSDHIKPNKHSKIYIEHGCTLWLKKKWKNRKYYDTVAKTLSYIWSARVKHYNSPVK